MVHTIAEQDARADRGHGAVFNQDLIASSLLPGASVSARALQASVDVDLLFRWPRMHLPSLREASASAANAAPSSEAAASSVAVRPGQSISGGGIEIDADVVRTRQRSAVNAGGLRCVLQRPRCATARDRTTRKHPLVDRRRSHRNEDEPRRSVRSAQTARADNPFCDAHVSVFRGRCGAA
jgi:transposase